MRQKLTKQYVGVGQIVRRYWRAYGGADAVLWSPYFLTAIVLSLCLTPNWATAAWFDVVIEILPNLVGFSIAGYSIWLGFGNDKFVAFMTHVDKDGDTSPYVSTNASFTHFIVVQALALIAAVIAKALDFPLGADSMIVKMYALLHVEPEATRLIVRHLGAFVGIALFFYALVLTFATVFQLMRLAGWFQAFVAANAAIERGIKEPTARTGNEAERV